MRYPTHFKNVLPKAGLNDEVIQNHEVCIQTRGMLYSNMMDFADETRAQETIKESL